MGHLQGVFAGRCALICHCFVLGVQSLFPRLGAASSFCVNIPKAYHSLQVRFLLKVHGGLIEGSRSGVDILVGIGHAWTLPPVFDGSVEGPLMHASGTVVAAELHFVPINSGLLVLLQVGAPMRTSVQAGRLAWRALPAIVHFESPEQACVDRSVLCSAETRLKRPILIIWFFLCVRLSQLLGGLPNNIYRLMSRVVFGCRLIMHSFLGTRRSIVFDLKSYLVEVVDRAQLVARPAARQGFPCCFARSAWWICILMLEGCCVRVAPMHGSRSVDLKQHVISAFRRVQAIVPTLWREVVLGMRLLRSR